MCDVCKKAHAILERGAGLPAAGDHARLIIQQCERRDAMRNARNASRNAAAPTPKEDPAWLSLLGLVLLAALLAIGWAVTR